MHIPSVTKSTPTNLSGDSDILTQPGVINHLFDISANTKSEPLDPDLQRIVMAIKTDDFGSQMQALIIDLVRLLAHIRKQNAELWQSQSSLAFTTAKSVANSQKEQAKATARAEQVGAGVTIAQSMAEIGVATFTTAASNRAISRYKDEIDSKDWTIDNPEYVNRPQGPREFVRPSDSPPAYNEKGATPSAAKVNIEEKGKLETKGPRPGDDEGAEDGPPARIVDTRAKEQALNDRVRNYYSKVEQRSRAVNAMIAALSSSLKIIGTQYTIEAGTHQASATIEQAAMQYLQSQGQYSNEYASEMREYIRSILETAKSIEQARHQASTAVIAIA